MKKLERATCRALLMTVCATAVLGLPNAAHAEPAKYFIAIHCDPQHAEERDWNALVDLVAAADGRGQKLTIQLNPVWGSTIASVPGSLDTIAAWVTTGHEISGHHHIWSHSGGWDGYSLEEGADEDPDYLGDMQQWLADLESILPEGTSIQTVSAKDHDFPPGVAFQTGGSNSTPDPNDAASIPTPKFLAGQLVWNLNHAALIAGGTWQIDGMMASFIATSPEQIFGAAVHPHDYYIGNRAEVDRWLDFLLNRDPDAIRSVTAGSVLLEHLDSIEGVPAGSSTSLAVQIATLLAFGGLALRRTRRTPRN